MLHFHVSHFFGVGFKSHGVVIPSQDGLTLVFRENEQDVALLNTETSKIRIGWDNLAKVDCSRGFFEHEVNLEVIALAAMDEIPGLKKNTICLEIRKQDSEALDRFEVEIEEFRSGRRKDSSDDDLDDIRDFLSS